MPYLIDGHNLIPKVGLRLDSVDDELELIELLQAHSRRARSPIEVFFDGAPAGQSGSRKFGRITAIFVSQASTADAAIRHRLRNLGRDARNWTVVSSDHEVLRAAKTARAQAQTADEFAANMNRERAAINAKRGANPGRGDAGGMSDAEVKDWLEVFKKRRS